MAELPCAQLQGWKIYRSLDVDYVLVVFGGVVGYPSDDINKFLWMVRATLCAKLGSDAALQNTGV